MSISFLTKRKDRRGERGKDKEEADISEIITTTEKKRKNL